MPSWVVVRLIQEALIEGWGIGRCPLSLPPPANITFPNATGLIFSSFWFTSVIALKVQVRETQER